MAIELAHGVSAEIPLVTEYMEVKNQRLALDRASRTLAAREEALKYEITKQWKNNELVIPDDIDFKYDEKTVPFVEDWPAFLDWVVKNEAIDMLEKRLSKSAAWSRMELGVDVPGLIAVLKSDITVVPATKRSEL